ncbi:MAG: surface glycoprotein, partial [Ruminococcus sp.]|nr:surface glycoprotein [Ruminococcus sp.]
MKTSFKKLTSVFLAVVMLFSVFAVTVSAADTGISSTGGGTIAFTDNQGWGDNIYAY